MLSVFGWGFFASLIAINSRENLTVLFWKSAVCSVSFISVFLLHITYVLCKQNLNIKRILIFAYFQAFIFSVLLTNTNIITDFSSIIKYYNNSIFIPVPGKFYILWFISWSIIVTYAHFHLIKLSLKQETKDRISFILFSSASIIGFLCGSMNFLYFLDYPLFKFANFGLTIYCVLQTYAIFKYRLFGIEIIFKKGILYSILIAIFTSAYLLIIFIAERLFRGMVGYKSFFVSLSSAFVLAILFNPLRNKIQSIIDRLFLGKTRDEIQQENELLKQEIERSERLKTANTLALGLAHEVKNPLTTIKTFAEFLPEKFKDEEFVHKFSKIIPAEVERINNIVHQLLDFAKPSPPVFKETKFHNIIREILTFLSNDLLKKKIKVTENFQDTTLLIKIDPMQIKQALLNIILNAMDAMPNGGNLSIKTQIQNNQLIINILDTGHGISKENLNRIFDPFFTTKDSGTGLGLSVTNQIIKNHGGTIEVKSEVEKGASFIIKLPITKDDL